MVRILVAHSAYSSKAPSGENDVVIAEIELLRSAGHMVEAFMPSSDLLEGSFGRKLAAAVGPVGNPIGLKQLSVAAKQFRPDAVHFHNLSPMIGPAALSWATQAAIPSILTLHNFRLDCANGLHFRPVVGKCTVCVDANNNGHAVLHGCYRGSIPQTAAVVAGMGFHNRRHTIHQVDQFVVLNGVARQRLLNRGISIDRINLRSAWASRPPHGMVVGRRKQVLYAGRLDHYKGIRTLIEGWRQAAIHQLGWRLVVAGSGPLEHLITDAHTMGVEFRGRMTRDEVVNEQLRSAAVAVPSTLLEGFPLLIAEAYAAGALVMASAELACAPGLNESCTMVVGDQPSDWAAAISRLPGLDLQRVSDSAKLVFEQAHSPEVALGELELIYRQAIGQ